MTVEQAVLIVTAIGGGISWGFVQFIKPELMEAKKRKKDLYAMVYSMHKELNFNGGFSIKDSIYRIEARLDRIEDGQRTVMNVQNVAFWESNEAGEVIYASPALCKLVGRSESEILGNNWIACIEAGEKERVFAEWNFSVENKSPFDEQYHYKKPDGSLIKVWGLAFHRVVKDTFIGSLGKLEKV